MPERQGEEVCVGCGLLHGDGPDDRRGPPTYTIVEVTRYVILADGEETYCLERDCHAPGVAYVTREDAESVMRELEEDDAIWAAQAARYREGNHA